MKLIRVNETTLINPLDIADVQHGFDDITEPVRDAWTTDPPEPPKRKVVGKCMWLTVRMQTSGDRYPFRAEEAERIFAELKDQGTID